MLGRGSIEIGRICRSCDGRCVKHGVPWLWGDSRGDQMSIVKLGRWQVALVVLVCGALAGCPSGSSAKKLDGVYHADASPIVITLKDGKATVTIAGESQTMDYKVEGSKLTIV